MAWLDDWMRDNKDFSKWPQQLDMIFGSHRLYYLGDLRVRIKNYYKGARTDLAFDLTWRPDLDFDLFPRIVHTPDR